MDIVLAPPASGKTTKALVELLHSTDNYLVVPSSQIRWYKDNYPVIADRIFSITELQRKKNLDFTSAIIDNAETILQEIIYSAAHGSSIKMLTMRDSYND